MKKKRNSERQTRIESLEVREMLAADVNLLDGILTVSGSEKNDQIEFVEVADEKIQVSVRSQGQEQVKQFSASDVRLIQVSGNDGNDRIKNGTSIRSKIYGGNGQDSLEGGSANDFIVGGTGNDRLFGKAGRDRLVGNAGDDRILGGSGHDILIGNGGHDNLFGQAGNDLLRGGSGNDRILGGSGHDRIFGDAGNDQLLGQGGNDQMEGAAGTDNLRGGGGENRITASAGDVFSLTDKDKIENKPNPGNLSYSVVNRILSVTGSDAKDHIRVFGNRASITLEDAGKEIGSFQGIQSVEIVGKGGADLVDLTGLIISSRVFGGDGDDTIKGGSAVDVIFGGIGDDEIYGAAGNDILYGDHGRDIIVGNAGEDWISYGTTPVGRVNDVQVFGSDDVDIENLAYDSKVLFDLEHRFRDKYGFVMLQSSGQPHPDGEATYVTAATAAGLAAQTFEMSDGSMLDSTNRLIEELLHTLIHHAWDSKGNPVRHPEIFDFDNAGNILRTDPMTKDSFGQIITAALYAHQSPNTTEAAKAMAVKLVQKWNEYLVLNQFRTVPEHIWQEVQTGSGSLTYDIYSKGQDGTLKKKMAKGPEAYLLLPHERYALKNVGARLGLQTAHWDVWSGLAKSVDQVVADYLGNLTEQGVKSILQQVRFSKSIDIELSYKGKVYFEIDKSISFDISAATEDRIAGAVGDLIKGMAKANNILNSGSELAGLVVDRLLDSVPKELGKEIWRPILTTAVNQVLPWMDGEILTEVSTFVGTLQLMKKDTKPANFGYAVWPFLAEMETRPEVNDLLRPFVRDMVGYLRGNNVDNGMWAHIGRDPGAVSNQLNRFRNAAQGRDRWSDFSLHRGKDFWAKDFDIHKASARIDYIVLNGLQTKGAPEGVGDVLANWTDGMIDAAEKALMDLVNRVKKEFANAGEYIQEKWDAAGRYIKEKWDAAGRYAKEKWDAAGNYVSEKWDAAGNYFQEKGNSLGKTYTEARDAAGKFISKGWTNGSNWIDQRFDSAGKVVREWVYYDEAGKKIKQFRRWTGDKLTDLEEFSKDGWKSVDKWVNSKGQWVSQRFDAAGNKIKEWVYFDDAGKKLYEFRQWAGNKLTDFEQYTRSGWKYVDKWANSKGQWISQRFDSAGKVVKEWIYYDDVGKKLYEFRKWSGDRLTDFEQFTKSGWKSIDKWVSDKGQWISQRFDSAGNVIKEWVYYDAVGKKLKQWGTWSNNKLTNLERYTSNGFKTLDAYFSTSGHWVEKSFNNGRETAVRFWTSTGKYVGDKLKNFKDAASSLDPTTKSWWPF